MSQDEDREQAFLQHAREFAAHMRKGPHRTAADWKRYEREHARERRQWKRRKRKEADE